MFAGEHINGTLPGYCTVLENPVKHTHRLVCTGALQCPFPPGVRYKPRGPSLNSRSTLELHRTYLENHILRISSFFDFFFFL